MALGETRKRRSTFVAPKLQITSMMDMFTIILIFLLFSFSNRPETMQLEKDLLLPKSTAQLNYEDSVRITATEKMLKVGETIVAVIEDGKLKDFPSDNVTETDLYKSLKASNNKKAASGETKPVLFLCDRRLSFNTINRIIKTAAQAGYPNFQFAVLKK